MTSSPLRIPSWLACRGADARGERRRRPWRGVRSLRGCGLLCLVFVFLCSTACAAVEAETPGGSDPLARAERQHEDLSPAADPSNTPERPIASEAAAEEMPAAMETEEALPVEPPSDALALAEPLKEDAVDPVNAVAPLQTPPPPAAVAAVPEKAPVRIQGWEQGPIREEYTTGLTRIVVHEMLGGRAFKYTFLDDPARLVVDILDAEDPILLDRIVLRGEAFHRVRVGWYPEKTRLVFDLRDSGLPEPAVYRDGGDLVVQAGDEAAVTAAAPTPMGGPEKPVQVAQADWKPVRVTAIDFHQSDTSSDVVIGLDAQVPYDVQEKGKNILVLLMGAEIPSHLQRPLDTQAFPSAILSIVPEQVGTGPGGQAKILVHLREMRPYDVLEDTSGIRLSVQLPEVPPEIPLLPPPELPVAVAQPQENPEEGLKPVPAPAEPPKPAAPEAQAEPPAPEAEAPAMAEAPAAKPAPKPTAKPAPRPEPPRQATAPPTKVVSSRPQARGVLTRYSGKKISLDFKDADIQNVLRLIAEVSGKNIVISDAVQGKVTVRLLNVPWDMALDVILKTYALDQEPLAQNIIRVAPFSQLKKEREEAFKADEALQKVEALRTEVVPVNYAKAAELEALLGRLKSRRQDAGILVDERTNSLVLKDLPKNIGEMIRLVRHLDTPTPQVLIEAKIVELDVDFERDLGIQWGTLYKAGPATGNPTGLNFPAQVGIGGAVENISGEVARGIANPVVNLPAAVDDTAGGALGISLASITNSFQLDLQLSALEKKNHARVLSSPRVATLNNQEARIEQGQEVPFQTTSDEGTKTEFKDAKLRLSVTPQITFDGSIIMSIIVNNDTPIRDPTVGFIIGKKEAKTTVLVKDADTAVIGGIYTNNEAETLGAVPWFHEIPGVGYLFKNKGISRKRTELIIFITPRILPSRPVQAHEWAE